MTADLPGIPSARIDAEPLDYPTPGVYPAAAAREALLRAVLADAGVELGAYDERIVAWFADFAD